MTSPKTLIPVGLIVLLAAYSVGRYSAVTSDEGNAANPQPFIHPVKTSRWTVMQRVDHVASNGAIVTGDWTPVRRFDAQTECESDARARASLVLDNADTALLAKQERAFQRERSKLAVEAEDIKRRQAEFNYIKSGVDIDALGPEDRVALVRQEFAIRRDRAKLSERELELMKRHEHRLKQEAAKPRADGGIETWLPTGGKTIGYWEVPSHYGMNDRQQKLPELFEAAILTDRILTELKDNKKHTNHGHWVVSQLRWK